MPELDTITIRGFKSIAAIEKLKLENINKDSHPKPYIHAGKETFSKKASIVEIALKEEIQKVIGSNFNPDRFTPLS